MFEKLTRSAALHRPVFSGELTRDDLLRDHRDNNSVTMASRFHIHGTTTGRVTVIYGMHSGIELIGFS